MTFNPTLTIETSDVTWLNTDVWWQRWPTQLIISATDGKVCRDCKLTDRQKSEATAPPGECWVRVKWEQVTTSQQQTSTDIDDDDDDVDDDDIELLTSLSTFDTRPCLHRHTNTHTYNTNTTDTITNSTTSTDTWITTTNIKVTTVSACIFWSSLLQFAQPTVLSNLHWLPITSR